MPTPHISSTLLIVTLAVALAGLVNGCIREQPLDYPADPGGSDGPGGVMAMGGAPTGGEMGPGGAPTGGEMGPGGTPAGGEMGPGGAPAGGEMGPGGAPAGGEMGPGGASAGGMSGAGGDVRPPECAANSDCPVMQRCVDGQCVEEPPPGCGADADCPRGERCVGGQCVAGPCASNEECPGQVCVDRTCVEADGQPCRLDTDCPRTHACRDRACLAEPLCVPFCVGWVLCGLEGSPPIEECMPICREELAENPERTERMSHCFVVEIEAGECVLARFAQCVDAPAGPQPCERNDDCPAGQQCLGDICADSQCGETCAEHDRCQNPGLDHNECLQFCEALNAHRLSLFYACHARHVAHGRCDPDGYENCNRVAPVACESNADCQQSDVCLGGICNPGLVTAGACDGEITGIVPGTYYGTTTGAQDTMSPSACAAGTRGEEVIYRLMNRHREERVFCVDTLGSDFDTILYAHPGADAQRDCPSPNGETCNDDVGRNRASAIELVMPRTGTQFLVVDGFNASGNFQLNVYVGACE